MDYLESIFNLKGKVAIVTGGLGILGTEYVEALASAGAKVAVWDLKEQQGHRLETLARTLPIKFFKVDLKDKKQIESSTQEIVSVWGVPDILINNAAMDFPPQPGSNENFENYPDEKWNAVQDVNLGGMIRCCQIIGGLMAKNGRGSIINISSMYGLVSPDQRIYNNFVKPYSYTVTKSGVLGLTKYLATYWGAKGVRVNTLTPGGVLGSQDPEFIAKYSAKSPLGRMANKNEYCGAILFLASDASSYMTGSNLIIDGGWTAW